MKKRYDEAEMLKKINELVNEFAEKEDVMSISSFDTAVRSAYIVGLIDGVKLLDENLDCWSNC